jgi:DNA-binding MarR family transcriptional regulator
MPTLWDPWPGKTKAICHARAAGRLVIRVVGPSGSSSASSAVGDAVAEAAAPATQRPGRRARATRGARPRPAPDRPVPVIARTFEADLSAPVVAAGSRIVNVRQISERVAMGRALWRELVVGFASQLGELNLGFTQLAALYVLAEGATTTVADLADSIGRSPSATSRLVDGLVRRRLVERRTEEEDGRLRTVWLTPRGQAILRMVDRARAEQFLSAVRPMPRGERALIAMGVAALATHAISRRGRLVRGSS